MSYTGFFAETDLYEVAKGGDSTKGSWVVPVSRADGISEDDFVRHTDETTGESRAVLYRQGEFVFRLAGRERQQSASYYTPEVLTRFTVSQALAELLDADGRTTTAEDILSLTICEPALGSGAFVIEAVRQLAEEYLTRRQSELGVRIDPDDYPRELQRVKAWIALHRVHGVDLNATAVELAEISLWLDTMVAGLEAPWFGLHLRRGNSLIGARHSVYPRAFVDNKSWLTSPPRDVSFAADVSSASAPVPDASASAPVPDASASAPVPDARPARDSLSSSPLAPLASPAEAVPTPGHALTGVRDSRFDLTSGSPGDRLFEVMVGTVLPGVPLARRVTVHSRMMAGTVLLGVPLVRRLTVLRVVVGVIRLMLPLWVGFTISYCPRRGGGPPPTPRRPPPLPRRPPNP